jgi:hypothetical protein
MARQIIKQPDGRYAVFSTGTDRWISFNMTRQGLIEQAEQQAAQDARARTAALLDEVDAAQDVHEVYPYGWTFAEANAHSKDSGGIVLDGPVDEQLLEEFAAQRGDL